MNQKHGIDPFDPPEVEFFPVSTKLIPMRYIAGLPLPTIALVVFAVGVIPIPQWINWLACAVTALFIIWLLWIIPRQVRFMAWGRTDSDVFVRSGRMFRSMSCTPFGRIQFIDVTRGPLERMFGTATLSIHTASTIFDEEIPGLTPEIAAQLRAEFSQAAHEELAGL